MKKELKKGIKSRIAFFVYIFIFALILGLAYSTTIEQKKAPPSEEKLVTDLEPGKLVLTDCELVTSELLGSSRIDAVYPIVRNVGGQSIVVDEVLCYFGNRIGVNAGGVIEPGEEESLGDWFAQDWWEDDESVSFGAINPERSRTIRFVFFENVSTEGMSVGEAYHALKEKKIGNVILENEIVYAFENIAFETRINKSWSFNTSEYEFPYTINFETMRITNRFDSDDAKEGYKWVVFEFVIEYGGLREDRSGGNRTLEYFELEVDEGYIYEVSGWRESWLHNLSAWGDGELDFYPGESYKGEIGFEILADTEPVSLRGLYGFESIQIDLKTTYEQSRNILTKIC